jgi:hypothetical protein
MWSAKLVARSNQRCLGKELTMDFGSLEIV